MNLKDLYVSYAKDITDAPEQFHQALSYFMVSSVIGKNVFMPFGYKKLYPNLYILIGAPSSLHRKSWSQSMAVHLIEIIKPSLEIHETSSREAFIAELADEERVPSETGIVAIDELGGFLNRIKHKRHFEGFMQDLSSAYDNRKIIRRVGATNETKKIHTIQEPFLNLTAACSLDWLTKSAETDDISGGFLARFLWIIEDKKIRSPKDEPGNEDPEKKQKIIQQLNHISNFVGMAEFEPKTRTKWQEWYSGFRGNYQGGKWDANYERLTVIAKKLAVLNAIMRYAEIEQAPLNGKLFINTEDLVEAQLFVESTIASFSKVVIGDNKHDVLAQKVILFIRKMPTYTATRSEVLRGVRGLDAWTFGNITKTLIQSDQIEVSEVISGAGKPVVIYKYVGLNGQNPELDRVRRS